MSDYPDYASLLASEAALGIFYPPPHPPPSSPGSNQQSMSTSAQPTSSAPSYGQPSAPSSSSRSTDETIDLRSELPSTRGTQSASLSGQLAAPSSSSRSANETFDFPSGIHSIWSPQAALGLAQPSAYRQSSTIGHPPTSFGQPLSIPKETSISTPESDQSEVWDDFEDSPAAQTPLSSSPPIMTDSQPEVETIDPKQLMTTPAILSTWHPQSASELGQPSADGNSSTIEQPLTSSETPPQQSVDQASTLSTSPPAYQTVTVKFLADGERPCDYAGGIYRYSFDYRTYNEISTGVTVNGLVRFLRQENAKLHGVRDMIGVTVMVEKGKKKYAARETLLEEGEMADKRLVDLGWGEDCAEIWLIVKRPEGIRRPNQTSSFVSIASLREAEREHAGAGP